MVICPLKARDSKRVACTYILYFLIVVCEICINTRLQHIHNFRIEEQLDCIGSSNLLGLFNGDTSIAKFFTFLDSQRPH